MYHQARIGLSLSLAAILFALSCLCSSSLAQVQICTREYTAMSYCDTSGNTTPSGYEINFINSILGSLVSNGDAAYVSITWNCMTDVPSIMDQLARPAGNRTCDIGIGSIAQTSLGLGIRSIFPSWEGGLMILISEKFTSNIWLFLKPFDAYLWLAIFSTGVVLAVALWFMEVKLNKVWQNPSAAWAKFSSIQFSSIGLLLQGIKDVVIHTPGSRLAVLGYCFFVIIIINSYIAVLTTQLTVNTRVFSVNKLSDLQNKPVGACESDVSALISRFNLSNVIAVPCGSPENETAAIEILRSKQVVALLWDSPLVLYYSSNGCDLYSIGTSFNLRDNAVAFASDTPLSAIAAFNQALVGIKEAGTVESLQQQDLYKQADCKAIPSLITNGIDIVDVAGLWIFLAATLGLALTLTFAFQLWRLVTPFFTPNPDAMSARDLGRISNGSQGSHFPKAFVRSMSLFSSFNGDSAALRNTVHAVGGAGSDEEQIEKLEAMLNKLGDKVQSMNQFVQKTVCKITDLVEGSNSGAGSKDFSQDVIVLKPVTMK